MWKQFTTQGNTKYLEILRKHYNNTKHSSIKMTPREATEKKNQGIVYFSYEIITETEIQNQWQSSD